MEDNLQIPREIDVAVLTRRIEEINMLIIKDNDHANFELDKLQNVYKLTHRKEIKIGFYKNGIAIENYPFYEYSSIESQKILSDILDGFTPYILKEKFPKGALLQVLNKVNCFYDADNELNFTKNNNFSGNSNPQGLFDIKCSEPNKKLSKEEFLYKLPKNILKDGRIYNIREDISNILSGGKEYKKLNELIFSKEESDLNQNLQKANFMEIIDYSDDNIDEINIYELGKLKEDYLSEIKVKKDLVNDNNLDILNISDKELIYQQVCKFKITIPILKGKNIMINISKKMFIKDVYDKLLDLIKKCSLLPKYKLLHNWSTISIVNHCFILLSTFPKRSFEYNNHLSFEQNNLYPTSVFIFEEKNK